MKKQTRKIKRKEYNLLKVELELAFKYELEICKMIYNNIK
jgi:hypothetical protein